MIPGRIGQAGSPGGGARLGAVLLAAAAVWGCGAGGDAGSVPERPVSVAVQTVESRYVDVERQWQGRLEPLRSYPVQAPRAGRVAAIAVQEGEAVRAGALVLSMDSPDLDARLAVLRERVTQLEAELARWRQLQQAGAAGQGEVTQATLRLLEVRDQASELEALVENYSVRSPAAGRVNSVQVAAGANVTQGQVLLFVDDDASLGVRLSVPAAETAYLEDLEHLSLRDDRGQLFPVRRIVFSSDAHPAFVRAEVYVGGEAGRRAATVVYHTREEVLTVPWTAVAADGERHWVAVIVEGEPARIERRTVELGRGHADGIEVRGGLVAGERVVRYEPRSHPDGRVVTPQEAGRGPAG